MSRFIFVFAVVIIVFAVAGVSFVGVANASAPGDPLYTVDRQMEALRFGLASGPQAALDLQVKLTAERMLELQEVTERGDLGNFNLAMESVGQAVAAIEALSTEQALAPEQVAALIDAALAGEPVAVQDDNDNNVDAGNLNDDDTTGGTTNENTNANTNDAGNTNENTNDDANTNTAYKHERTGGNCADGGDDSHPAANKLAGSYGVPASEIMDWFCGGYGFGEVALGYNVAQKMGIPANEVFQMRADGMGWGQIMHAYGLSGGGKKVKGTGGKPVVTPAPVVAPADLNAGPGNGNNGKGNNGNNGNNANNGNNGNNGNGGGNGNGNGQGGGKKP